MFHIIKRYFLFCKLGHFFFRSKGCFGTVLMGGITLKPNSVDKQYKYEVVRVAYPTSLSARNFWLVAVTKKLDLFVGSVFMFYKQEQDRCSCVALVKCNKPLLLSSLKVYKQTHVKCRSFVIFHVFPLPFLLSFLLFVSARHPTYLNGEVISCLRFF